MDLNRAVKELKVLRLQDDRVRAHGYTEKGQSNDSSTHWLS